MRSAFEGAASPFNTVEAEVREIESDFASGRMSAFGTSMTHELMMKDLRKVADLELQIYFRSSSLIREAFSEHSVLHRELHQQQSATSSSGAAASGGVAGVASGSTVGSSSSTGPVPIPPIGSPVALSAQQIGVPDSAFDHVVRSFRQLEGNLNGIGENLRQISRQVANLNDVADKVNGLQI